MDAPKGNAGSANPVFIFLLEHPFFFDQYFCELFRLAELEPRSGQFPLGRPFETTVNALSVFCFAGHPRTGLVASQKGVKEVCTVIVDHNLVKLERTAPASP